MGVILGADGKPLTQEIASIERDISRVFYGRTLTNADDTLMSRGGGKGLKIYDELKRDAHAGAVLAKRKLAVTSRPWVVDAASGSAIDKQAAELVKGALEYLRFNHVCKRLMEATLKGFAVSEIIWEYRGGAVLPARILARDQRRFVFDVDDQLHLLTPENMFDGEAMPDRKFIVHRRGADDDNPYGTGIGGMLFWPVFFKRNTITFWLTFADKFGNPTLLAHYPVGTEKPDQDKLLQVLKSVSQDAGVIVPEGQVIELLEAKRTGGVDTYEKLVLYMDEQISKATLGETMSTTAASAGLGSKQADVQNDVRIEGAEDDANELDETLNDTVVRWIVEFNLPGAGLPRLRRDFSEPEDLVARASRDKTLHDMGWEPSEDYILETYGEGWSKAPPKPPPVMPGFGGAPQNEDDPQFAEGRPLQRARGFNVAQQQKIEAASEALAGEYRALVGKRVEDLMSMLDETKDLVLFRERMGRLLDVQPAATAVNKIAQATLGAHFLGRGLARGSVPPKTSVKT